MSRPGLKPPEVRTIDISLEDLDGISRKKEEAPPFKGGCPVTLRLDEPDDIDAAQIGYLEKMILSCRADVADQTFRFRFRYDMHGTAHWHGQWFILDVHEGECVLRLAGRGDFDRSDGQMYKVDKASDFRGVLVARRNYAKDLQDGKRALTGPRNYSLILDVSWSILNAEDLKHALDLFKVAEVMSS